jgi:hypothetical protein
MRDPAAALKRRRQSISLSASIKKRAPAIMLKDLPMLEIVIAIE